MAGRIPSGKIVTDIDLDNIKAVKSLRELRQAVTGATNAWKAQTAELKSAGKATDSAEAKYKGLSEALNNQKKYVDSLKSELRRYSEIQKTANTSTKEGKHDYDNATEALKKTENQLGRAVAKLSSLSKQQDRAKKSMDYYKSGLAEAQKALKENNAVTRSYVERLSSQGKGYEAAKAKLTGYKNSLNNLTEQQKIQADELKRIASESGATSSAYKRQQVRVNETITSINHLNDKIKVSQKEVNNLRPTGFNRLVTSAKKVTTASDKMKNSLHSAWDHIKGGATAAAGAMGAVGVAAVSGAKKAQNLDQRYKEITNLAVNGGEKQKEVIKAVADMQRQGQSMSIKYGKSQQDIADAYEELVKRGYTTKQALGAMRSELQASVASGDDFKDVVSVSSTTLESFGMRASTTSKMTANTKRAVNELAYAADMTSTGFKDLGYGMSYVGSSAHQAGFGLAETASAMGILSNNGLEASKAGTGLNQVINRLSDSAGKLAKGDKKNVLAQLGIKPKEIMNSKGQLKSLATVFGVLNDHMKGMSKVQKINVIKSLFGTTGEQAGLILTKYNKDLGDLSKKTLEAGKNGKYVAELSAKNSETAKMQMARAKQAFEAFSITLGKQMLPAINEAGEELVVFLTKSKDGKQLMKDFAGGVSAVSNALVNLIKWVSHHRTATKTIAMLVMGGWTIAKGARFITWLGDIKKAYSGIKLGTHLVNGWDKFLIHLSNGKTKISSVASAFSKGFGKINKVAVKAGGKVVKGFKAGAKGIGKAGSWIGDKLLSATKSLIAKASSLGHKIGSAITKAIKASTKFSMGKRLATGAVAGAAVATPEVINAVKDRHSATKRSQDIGGAAGAVAGGALTSMIPVVGPLLAPIGAEIGKYAGRWGGQAVNKFTKGWQKNKPPKKFWSLENLGWSAHSMWKGFQKSVGNIIKWFKKNWKEVGVYFISPLAGAINSLYKHSPKFRKWVKSLVKGFKNAWKGIGKWFGNVGKSIQKSWKGMTKWFSKLGKNMAKGLKSAWKGMTKFFSNIGKGIQRAWRGMTSWFTKLGRGMSKGLKSTWHTITKWFSNIAKGIKNAWHGMTNFFGNLGKNSVKLFKSGWHGLTSWFTGIIDGIKNAWDGFWDKISGPIKTIQKVFTGKASIGGIHFANGTDWRKRYGVPAILNDGNDSPRTGNREGVLNPDGSVEVIQGRNVPYWLMPYQDVINARDMAHLFGRGIHLANGTKDFKITDYNVKTPKLLAEINETERKSYKLRKKKYDEDKRNRSKRERKNQHKGQTLVDQGLLTGASHRTGRAVWISDKLFEKLTTATKTKKHGKSTRRRSTSTRSRSYSGGSAISSSATRITANVSGASSVNSLAKTIKYIAGTHHASIKVKGTSTKSLSKLTSALKKISGKRSAKFTFKYSGTYKGKKSIDHLVSSIRKLKKNKSAKIKVKYSGTYKAKKSIERLVKEIKTLARNVKSINNTTRKSKFGSNIAKQAEIAVKGLEGKGNFAKTFKKLTKEFDKDLKSMSKSSEKEFKAMWTSIEKTEKSYQNKVDSALSGFSRKFKRGWSSLQSGIHNSFTHFWNNMISTAKRKLSNVLSVLNEAIGKINNVVKEFGGNSNAVHKVGTHLATGTDANGRLTQDTLAIVNDAKIGPRQEAIVTDKNDVILPKGNDIPVMLRKGWGVLNGTQTQQLGLPHFASGTGLKGLYELAKKYWKQPTSTGKSMFSAISDISGALGKIAQGMHKTGENQGVDWWSQLWKMVEDKVNDDSGDVSGLLKEAIKVSKGHRYVWGAKGPDVFDCSGLVEYAARKLGINLTAPSGTEYSQVEHIPRSEARMNDLVFYGPHGNEHVGIVKNKNLYWSAHSPTSHPNIGWDRIDSAPAHPILFGRIRGYHPKDDKNESIKANNSLQKLIKNQVGQGFWKTIQQIADKYGESNRPNISGSAKAWTKYIREAAEKMHTHATDTDVAKIVSMIQGESHGDAKITQPGKDPDGDGSGPARGLMQFKTRTFDTYKVRGHNNIYNGWDQLLALFNDSNWKNDIHFGSGWGPSGHRRFANGGIATMPSVFGEAGPEMAVPLIPSKSTRAWELIGKAVGILSSQSGFGNQQQLNSKDVKEEHDLLKAMLLILQQMNAKNNDVNIKLTTPEGRTLWEVVKPYQKADQRADAIRERKGLSARFR